MIRPYTSLIRGPILLFVPFIHCQLHNSISHFYVAFICHPNFHSLFTLPLPSPRCCTLTSIFLCFLCLLRIPAFPGSRIYLYPSTHIARDSDIVHILCSSFLYILFEALLVTEVLRACYLTLKSCL